MRGVRTVRGRVAVVTGAASGIGRATALLLAERGARVALGDKDAEGLAGTARAIRESPSGAASEHPTGWDFAASRGTTVCEALLDVTRPDEVERFRAVVEAELGAPDIIVNAAGVVVVGSFDATSPDDWDQLLGVNLRGPALVCRAFLPLMKERRRGQIVNVASAAAFFTPRELIAYGATKHGLVGLSQGLREELAPFSIGVSLVCPGFVDTPIVGHARFVSSADPEAERRRVRELLARRGLGAERVAAAIVRAAEKGSGLVPVGVEAWVLYALERASPGASVRLVGLVRRLVDRRR